MKRILFTMLLLMLPVGARAQNGGYVSPSGSGSGSTAAPAPKMAFYLTSDCSTVVNAYCQNTFADTQQANACSWTNASTTINCFSWFSPIFAQVTNNVVSYGTHASTIQLPSTWVVGNSINVTGFPGGDSYLNQTCTLTAVTTTSVSCPLVHANAAPGSTGSMTNNSVGPFVAGDVGKSVMGGQTCANDQTSGTMAAGIISTSTTPTILTFISSTQVTISATPANTATLHPGYAQGACFIYGHLDDAASLALDTTMQSSSVCPKLFLASANYFLSKPHFFENPPACTQIGPGINGDGTGGFGNTTLPAGMEIEGRGVGNTAWYLTPSFPGGDPCNHKPTPTASGNACFAVPVMGKWADFRIDGGTQGTTPNMGGGNALIYVTVGSLRNFSCLNFGAYSAITGIEMGWLTFLTDVNNAGCGGIGLSQDAATGTSHGVRVVVENSGTNNLLMTGASAGVGGIGFTCEWCVFLGAPTFNNSSVIENHGGTLRLIGGSTTLALTAGNNNSAAYKCQTNAGCVLHSIGHHLLGTAAGANNSALLCTVNCTNYLTDTTLDATSVTYSDTAGSFLYDMGGNTLNMQKASVSGTLIADGRSLLAACTGVATASQTLGLFGTGPNETLTTCTSTTIGSGVLIPQARTVSTLMVTATAGGVNASSGVVTVLKNGVATAITCTTGTATSCNDFTHTAAFAKGDLLSIQFTTQAAETLAGVKAFAMWQ